jgi:selenocysteine lyase/cysteine desulfurase
MVVRAYLDHAGLGRVRATAVAAMHTALHDVLPFGSAEIGRLFATRAAARGTIARLLDCTPDEVALVPNTSTGVHLVADGLRWRPGDRVVVFDRDFPANVRPWQRLERYGVALDWVPMRHGGYELEDVAAAVRPTTRLVAVSQVHFATGFRIDLDAVCALAAGVGALVCVDGVQGVGALPLSVAKTPVDFLAAGGHKWLGGPPGTGVFYCRASRLALLESVPTGWFGFQGAAELMKQPGHLRYDLPERTGANRVEGGMYDLVGMAGFAAALAELETVGMIEVAARIRTLTDRIRIGLADIGYPVAGPDEECRRSGIVSFSDPNGFAGRIVERLVDDGIHVSCPDGLVRVSPHFWTTDDEVETFLSNMASQLLDSARTG